MVLNFQTLSSEMLKRQNPIFVTIETLNLMIDNSTTTPIPNNTPETDAEESNDSVVSSNDPVRTDAELAAGEDAEALNVLGAQSSGAEGSPPSTSNDSFKSVLKSVKSFVKEAWSSSDGSVYATIEIESGIPHHVPLDSAKLKALLTQRVYSETGIVSNAHIDKALMLLSADAFVEGAVYEPHVRIATTDDAVYLDLANEDREIVEITRRGWSIKKAGAVPVRFVVSPDMQPLPHPSQDATPQSLSKLQSIFGLEDDNFALLLGFIVGCFNPSKVYPLLAVQGEQGSGKTTLCRSVRNLIDPSSVPVQTAPANERDLVISASRSFLLTMDNLSGVSAAMSDAYCRLSTGGGFRTRKLYTGREEETFSVTRPVILNGIDEIGTRNDLADRLILLHLPPIDSTSRMTIAEISDQFADALPEVLGALCNSVSAALNGRDSVSLERTPRMADFAKWVVAAEPNLPLDEGAFLRAYEQNIIAAAKANVESDPVALAVFDFFREREKWEGSITGLRAQLAQLEDHDGLARMHVNKLTSDLKRATPALQRVGITVVRTNQSDAETRRTLWVLKNSSE